MAIQVSVRSFLFTYGHTFPYPYNHFCKGAAFWLMPKWNFGGHDYQALRRGGIQFELLISYKTDVLILILFYRILKFGNSINRSLFCNNTI